MKNRTKYMKSGLVLALLVSAGFAQDGSSTFEPVSATADSASFDYLSKTLNNIMGKAGISVGGQFRSRGFASTMSGNLLKMDENGVQDKYADKQTEAIVFSSLDLELKAGPHSALQARAMLRLHEDWRNMFASFATPLTIRWLSADGNVEDMFFYNVGDYKQRYTSLSLWAPEPEIMYEPYVFARQRREVMNEVFAGDNNRALQGVNMGFAAKVTPLFDEVRARGYFTRLRTQGKTELTLRPSGVDTKEVIMDRYSTGGELFLNVVPDAEIGMTYIYTGDAIGTHKAGDKPENYVDLDRTTVLGFNGAVGTGFVSSIDEEKLNVRLDAELAMSKYKTYDTLTNESVQSGFAFNANLGTKVGLSDIGSLNLDLGFVYNDSAFVNEMAQSPVFYNRQILNTNVANANNSFDGLYKSVFKYTPAEGELDPKAPVNKIAWTRGVLTVDELASLSTGTDVDAEEGTEETSKNSTFKPQLDRTFSPVMYYGDATPNRMGIRTELSGEFFNKMIVASALFNMMSTPNSMTPVDATDPDDYLPTKQDFLQMGGGASVDISKIGNWWAYPFVLSGSAKYSKIDNQTTSKLPNDQTEVTFINAGLYWKFWKKTALIGGVQTITGVTKVGTLDVDMPVFSSTVKEYQWAGGLEYKVTDGGTLTGTIGKVGRSYETNTDATSETKSNWNDFSSMQFDLFLTVAF